MNHRGRPRLSVDITPEQEEKLRDLIPWGLKSPLFNVIIEDLIDLLKDTTSRRLFIALVVKRKVKILDTLKSTKPIVREKEKRDGSA